MARFNTTTAPLMILLLVCCPFLLQVHAIKQPLKRFQHSIRGEGGGGGGGDNDDGHRRSLKNDKLDDIGAGGDQQEYPLPAPTSQPEYTVESAFGDDVKDEQDEDERVDFVGADVSENQLSENNGDDSNNDDKNNSDGEQGRMMQAETISFVKIPTILVEMGVVIAPTSRTSLTTVTSSNTAVEEVMEEYFEGLLSSEIMGNNFVSSDMEVIMSQSDRFGNGSHLEFQVNGDAAFQYAPVPNEAALEIVLASYFRSTWDKNDLETFLEENGITGAQVVSVSIGNDSTTETLTETSSVTTTSEGEGGNDKKAGLIVGLTILFVCVFALVFIFIFTRNTDRKEWFGKCQTWCEAKCARMQRNNFEKKGWSGFQDDGSNSVTPLGKSASDTSVESDQKSLLEWLTAKWNMLQLQHEKEQPSEVLQSIKVVVDDGKGMVLSSDGAATCCIYRNNSAATVPVSNQKYADKNDTSPQKTLGTCTEDNESEDNWSSDGRILSYPRSLSPPPPPPKSKHPWRDGTDAEKRAHASSKATVAPRPSTGPDNEDDYGNMASLVEWTKYLNPCLAPQFPTFKHESERLDNLVASLPRDLSLVDDDDSDTNAWSAPPPRRSRSRSGRQSQSSASPSPPPPRRRSSRSHSRSRT